MHYYRHRIYHAMLGRFCSRDPVGYEGGFNSFAYVSGSPSVRTDPMGLCHCGPDVTDSLMDLTRKVEAEFARLSWIQKQRICLPFFGDFHHEFGWDITRLALTGATPPKPMRISECPQGANCEDTVTVQRKCFRGWQVNYYLYGLGVSLCEQHYIVGGFAMTYRLSSQLRKFGRGPGGKALWYCKGYFGIQSPQCDWQTPDEMTETCPPCRHPWNEPLDGRISDICF